MATHRTFTGIVPGVLLAILLIMALLFLVGSGVEGEGYVIITDPDNVDALRPLADWKTQKGVPAEIHTTDSIYENFTGADQAEKIRNFLKDLENETGIDYLLLAGDNDTVPTRYAYCDDGYAGDGNDVPTDTYYAFLNGTWDDNDDSKYGEFGVDNITWAPDIYVGRLPASDSDTLETLVRNILDYEQNPAPGDWFNSGLFASAISNYDNDKNHDDVADDGANKTDHATLSVAVEDRFVPNNFTIERLFEHEGLAPSNYSYHHGLDPTNISARMSLGHSVAILGGHGSPTTSWRLLWVNDADDDGLNDGGSEEQWKAYVSTGTNIDTEGRKPLVYIESCSGGHFDRSGDSLAEHIVKNWGIGVAASSRISWYWTEWEPGEDGGEANQGLNYRYWEQFFGGLYAPGAALYESKADYVRDMGAHAAWEYKNLFNYNFFGDPEIPVWTAAPENFTIDYPEYLSTEAERLSITVRDSEGVGVSNATVTIMNDDLYFTGTTDQQGEIVFEFQEFPNASLLLTVVEHNFLPFWTHINLTTPPEVENFTFSANTTLRNNTAYIYVNATDDLDSEDNLTFTIEYRAPSGNWTALTDAYYDSNCSCWVAEFLPAIDWELGAYDLRVRFTDLNDCESEWVNGPEAIEVLNNLPVAMIESVTPTEADEGQPVFFAGNGTDVEGPITGYQWSSSRDGLLSNLSLFNTTLLSNGSHTIYFRVLDWDDAWSENVTITIRINGIPVAAIENITPEQANEGETVWFSGNGSDDGNISAYEWNSSLDGLLSNQSSFNLSNLTNGTHTIRFRVRDNNDTWSEEVTSTVTINGIPIASIEDLIPNPTNEGETVRFTGNGSDDGNLTGFAWRSDMDGNLSNYMSFNLSNLSNGTHTIYLKVKDNRDTWSEEVWTTLTVNGIPRATIEDIHPGAATEGEMVWFLGNASDDGAVTAYEWNSSLDGPLGNQRLLGLFRLSNGTHIIHFRVMDDDGLWSEPVLGTVTVNGIPRAIIENITPIAALEGETVSFTGNGSDDGAVTAYEWVSSLDGVLSNDRSFTLSILNNLSNGTHIIHFRVRDDEGVWSLNVTTAVEVNGIPRAAIEAVTPGVALDGETVEFFGNGSDDGILRKYHWTSSIDGVIYNDTAASFSIDNLSLGLHTLHLRVMDVEGVWSDPVEANVTIHSRPTATITLVAPDPALDTDEVRFVAEAEDDGSILYYRWTSDLEDGGWLYNGTESSFQSNILTPGNHTISLNVIDNHGVWSITVTTTLLVHQEPTASITSITPNPSTEGQNIHFMGMGTDDGAIARYLWTSNLDGTLYNGTEAEFDSSDLSVGIHTCGLTVVADLGVWSAEGSTTVPVIPKEKTDDSPSVSAGPAIVMIIGVGIMIARRKRE